jgi:hypothetical protein
MTVVVVGALVGAGCAAPGYSATKLERELEQAGATPQQAHCVTTKLEDTFDVNQLASYSDPTVKETATTRAILERCGIKNLKPPQ